MKYILSVLFLFFFFSGFTQIYQEMPQYGYRANRMAFDSTLQIPTVCGVPTLKSVVSVNKKAAIAFDSCNNKFYTYNPKTLTWSEVSGGGATPSLQDVATVGNTYDNGYAIVELNKEIAGTSGNYPFYFIGNEDIINRTSYIGFENDDVKLRVEQTGQFGKGININSKSFNIYNNDLSSSIDLDTSGLKIVKFLNGQSAKLAFHTRTPFATDYIAYMPVGYSNRTDTLATLDNVRYSVIDTSNRFVNNITRTSGKDSIIFFIGSTRYAIKDSVGTNPAPVGYYGAWQDNVTQTAAVSNTGYAMIFRTIDLSNGVSVVSNGTNLTRITFANTGVYNLQFSSQFQNADNAQHDITVWLRLNGTDVAGSAGLISVPARKSAGAGNEGHLITGWNYVLSVVAGQYYELMWSTTNAANVTMQFYAAGSPPPSAASVIMTVTQQSGIMAGTGITAINSLTGAAQTMVTGTDSTDFKIVSTGTTHKFNLPTASATNRGALSSANWSTFNSKLGASDTVSLSSRIDLRVKYTDTATMLTPYLRKIDTTNRFVNNISRTVGKDSIIFNIGSTRYAIKDSVGSGTSYTFSTGLTNSSGTVTNNLSTGVSGGQSVVGGTAASNSLTLSSTSNATKGKLLFGTSAYDEVNNRLGIGTASPVTNLHVSYSDNSYIQGMVLQNTNSGTTAITGMLLRNAAGTYVGQVSYYPSNYIIAAQANSVSLGSVDQQRLSFGANTSGTGSAQDITFSTFGTNSTYQMQIKGNGNVQINTNTDAGYRFDVNGTARVQGALNFNPTNTASGTTGNQTINKASGTVNIAAAGTTVTVTNSLVSATSIVYAVIRTNDATATIKNVVPAAGSFVINLGAATTAETSIGFFVIN